MIRTRLAIKTLEEFTCLGVPIYHREKKRKKIIGIFLDVSIYYSFYFLPKCTNEMRDNKHDDPVT